MKSNLRVMRQTYFTEVRWQTFEKSIPFGVLSKSDRIFGGSKYIGVTIPLSVNLGIECDILSKLRIGTLRFGLGASQVSKINK